MPEMHRLQNPIGTMDFSGWSVVCGARHATHATWEPTLVTCQACLPGPPLEPAREPHEAHPPDASRAPCTCGPTVPLCEACRAWNRQHRGTPTRVAGVRTEKQLQEALRALAKHYGFLYFHATDSRHSPAGFPDTVLLRGTRCIIAELKGAKGLLTREQTTWLEAFRQIPGCEVHVWYPEDLGRIEEVLR